LLVNRYVFESGDVPDATSDVNGDVPTAHVTVVGVSPGSSHRPTVAKSSVVVLPTENESVTKKLWALDTPQASIVPLIGPLSYTMELARADVTLKPSVRTTKVRERPRRMGGFLRQSDL
jgi:hypothetical protein